MKEELTSRKPSATGLGALRLRELEVRRIEQHFDDARKWFETSVDGLTNDGGSFEELYAFSIGDRAITAGLIAGANFVEFLQETHGSRNENEQFDFTKLSRVGDAAELIAPYLTWLVDDRKSLKKISTKNTRVHEHPSLTPLEKYSACDTLAPSTIVSMLKGVNTFFRILSVTEGAIVKRRHLEQATKLLLRFRGQVVTYDTWPLLIVDVQHAFERRPPKTHLELAYYICVLMMTKYGLRPSSLFPYNGKGGIRLAHIQGIGYDPDHNEYLISWADTQNKTDVNLARLESFPLISTEERCDLARLLVYFLFARGVFMKPWPLAHEQNDFEMLEHTKNWFLFGGSSGSGQNVAFSNDTLPDSTSFYQRAYLLVAAALNVPPQFLTPKSSREGIVYERIMQHCNSVDLPTFESCKAAGRGDTATWKGGSDAIEPYMNSCEGQHKVALQKLLQLRKFQPHKKHRIEDFFFFLHRFEDFEKKHAPTTAVEREHVEIAARLIALSEQRKAEALAKQKRDEAESYRRVGDDKAAREAETEASRQENKSSDETRNVRERVLVERLSFMMRGEKIKRAMKKCIYSGGEMKLKPSEVLDMDKSLQWASVFAHIPCTLSAFASFPDDLRGNPTCGCPMDNCDHETGDATSMKAHIEEHFRAEAPGPRCRCGEPVSKPKVIRTFGQWKNHHENWHRWRVCMICNQKLQSNGEITAHRKDYSSHDVRDWSAVNLEFAVPPAMPCGCRRGQCPFEQDSRIRTLVDKQLIDACTAASQHVFGRDIRFTATGRRLGSQDVGIDLKKQWLIACGTLLSSSVNLDECLGYRMEVAYGLRQPRLPTWLSPPFASLAEERDGSDIEGVDNAATNASPPTRTENGDDLPGGLADTPQHDEEQPSSSTGAHGQDQVTATLTSVDNATNESAHRKQGIVKRFASWIGFKK